MRLFDKMWSQEPRFKAAVLKPRDAKLTQMPNAPCTVMVADEIANHLYCSNQEFWGPDDTPYAIPPWDWTFIEWQMPSIEAANRGEYQPTAGQQGALVEHTRNPQLVQNTQDRMRRELAVRFVPGKWKDANGHAVSLDEMHARIASIASLARMQLANFSPTIGGACFMDITQMWCLSETGRILSADSEGPGVQGLHELYGAEEAHRCLGSFTNIIGLAFTFANCANVKLEDVTVEMASTPKIQRRLKIPEVKRYTLNICGHSTQRRVNTEPGQVGIMPWHLCRGHFATYTAERPRFGRLKDGVGRFWIEPHMRGKKDRGEIIKDYAITDPKGPKYGGDSQVRQPVLDG